ncbi:glycosyltransferase family 4 protein [Micromonospora phytophila]|uniref:glycosyltransferase family 4 protein n=1 Tax=Micromonospora phytophila TaxID=709888 RepID=UPI002030503E|nr:glycosyltransferase family 4 protein [Micromonospora phytophila]MCM0674749.1 glycosyltransferase family 4 protein [Micromonospora phytophila]
MNTSPRRTRHVIVLNHYAKPLSEPGGTRHVELFGRLTGWDWTIIAGDRDVYSRRRFTDREPHFVRVRVPAYTRNDHRRVLNWLGYSAGALVHSVFRRRPAVVYASSPHILAPVAGWLAATFWRVPFVLEIRDLWPESIVGTGYLRRGSPLHRLLSGLERWLYRRADRIVMVADGWRSYFRSLGIDEGKLVWVSNSAEPSAFALRHDRYTPLRDRLPVCGRLIVFAGAHGQANGLDELLDAAAELPEHTFALIGDGIDKPRLVARARAEELSNVHFLDMIPKAEFAGILGGADVGVHVLADAAVFRMGASPNKLYDYLAAGVPVVTNCPGEPHDIVRESDSGVAVEPGKLVVGLRELLERDPALLPEMGRRGRQFIAAHRSRTAMASRLQRVLDEVVAAPTPAGRNAALRLLRPRAARVEVRAKADDQPSSTRSNSDDNPETGTNGSALPVSTR